MFAPVRVVSYCFPLVYKFYLPVERLEYCFSLRMSRKLASGIFEISVLINIPEVSKWTTVHYPSWRPLDAVH